MSSPPDFRRINRQDLPGSPAWVDNLLSPVNLFFEQTYALLNGSVDFQNITGQQITTTFSTPSNYLDGENLNFNTISFAVDFSGVTSVIISSIDINSNNTTISNKPVTLPVGGWRETSAGKIIINYITGLQANTAYSVTFLCF